MIYDEHGNVIGQGNTDRDVIKCPNCGKTYPIGLSKCPYCKYQSRKQENASNIKWSIIWTIVIFIVLAIEDHFICR